MGNHTKPFFWFSEVSVKVEDDLRCQPDSPTTPSPEGSSNPGIISGSPPEGGLDKKDNDSKEEGQPQKVSYEFKNIVFRIKKF